MKKSFTVDLLLMAGVVAVGAGVFVWKLRDGDFGSESASALQALQKQAGANWQTLPVGDPGRAAGEHLQELAMRALAAHLVGSQDTIQTQFARAGIDPSSLMSDAQRAQIASSAAAARASA